MTGGGDIVDYIDKGMKLILDDLELEQADLAEWQQNNVREFVLVTMECDDEMIDGIDHQIPMTAALYSRTIAKLEELHAERTLQDFRNSFAGCFGS